MPIMKPDKWACHDIAGLIGKIPDNEVPKNIKTMRAIKMLDGDRSNIAAAKRNPPYPKIMPL